MTYVIKADGNLTNPLPDTPVIPDLSTGFYFRFKASDLTLTNGATVESWVGQGPAPAANRTLNAATNTNWSKPVYSATGGPNGSPTLLFNGSNQHLRTTDAQVTAYTGPLTIAMVCSGVTNDTGTNNARFFGSTAAGQLTIQPSAAGNVYSFVSGQDIFSHPNPGGHFIVVASLSSASLIGALSSVSAVTSVAAPVGFLPSFTGFGIGGSFSATPDNPLNGTVTDIWGFTRALGVGDVNAIVAQLRAEYNL